MKYKAGYKYQLAETYSIAMPWLADQPDHAADWLNVAGATLTIERGYCWDGASGPTWDSRSSMRASLVHDALYQLMRLGVLPEACREMADQALYDLCVEDGMFRPRAWAWWKAVRLMAAGAAKNGTDREVLTAP